MPHLRGLPPALLRPDLHGWDPLRGRYLPARVGRDRRRAMRWVMGDELSAISYRPCPGTDASLCRAPTDLRPPTLLHSLVRPGHHGQRGEQAASPNVPDAGGRLREEYV